MNPSTALPMPQPAFVGIRLSLMMFLQYAVWGVWLPILAGYLGASVANGGLGFTGTQIGWILGTAGSLGAIASPFIAGQLADRVMNAERALGLLLILGGIVNAILATQTSYVSWLLLSCLYSVLYMPTLALTNSVAFANLADREKQFPPVRMFGTIGWIVASVAFPLVMMVTAVHAVSYWPFLDGTPRADQTSRIKYAIFASAGLSIIYGLYAFFLLPKTPPHRDASRPFAFAAAFKLLTRPAVLPLLIAALLISMVHSLYFVRTPGYITGAIGLGDKDVGPSMAIGQVSEIVVLALLGLFIRRIGYRWIIALGALSYVIRYAIFAFASDPMTMKLGMLLHGLNYGFFFAGSFLFVERISPSDIRHSAQTAFGIIILGLGPILGGLYNQFVIEKVATTATTFDYRTFWLMQSGVAFVALLTLVIGFSGRAAPIELPARE